MQTKSIDEIIAQIRMGDIIVKTEKGAAVKVEQTRHEFLFGTAITNHLATKHKNAMPEKDRKMFIKILSENFNYAVHENALKWYDCEKKPNVVDYSVADEIWEICHKLNIPMRGHCIFWEKEELVQKWLRKLPNPELRSAIGRRAIGVTKHFKGRISEFDLNNEMIQGEFYTHRFGYGIINEMAYMAKFGNPEIKLFVNDYGVLVEHGFNAYAYIMQIKDLLANGVPIDGIGCQGHFFLSRKNESSGMASTSPEHVQKMLDELAKFNLPIKITECLFMANNDKGMAEEMQTYFPILFAHPKVEAILMWGFWEEGHWIPHSAMWKKDWTPTAQVKAYHDLVFKKWWTKTSGKADKNGNYKTRGFYGDYEITSNGKTKKMKLSKKNGTLKVNF
ncbi:MAG: endo-1,4-beta-xylanase [Candidatus Ratteibacteria bacterium]|nr:endo-1,4-beta-xylanase [Candidatus Ratteibacteria bacterium]